MSCFRIGCERLSSASIKLTCLIFSLFYPGWHNRSSGSNPVNLQGDESAYGWPRIWRELKARGVRAGKERVRKLLKVQGIRAKGKKKFKVTTDNTHDLPISANLLARNFSVMQQSRVWTGDITYIHMDEGWLYLAVVIDLLSRQIVGFAMDHRMTRSLLIDDLRIAWLKRK